VGSNIAPGDLVDGKYRIIRTIGEGGWGIVFEGENVRTYKRVAIKILRPHSGITKDILIRFEREAQAAGRIGSEHIVEVYDLGSLGDGTHYMVMELLGGQELAARLRSGGPLPAVTVARLVLQLLDGLKAAHDAGILHRDLKPENLFLVPTRSGDEFVKILDFGISKFNSNVPQAQATMTGAVLGSPCYMAPEQARGLKQVDVRTDLYAVGTLMFESLTCRVPFEGDNFNDLMFRIVLAPRPDPRELRPDLDLGMAAIVVKAMSIDPKERFQTAEEMSAAIVDWLAAQGVPFVRTPELKRAGTPRISREPSRAPDAPRAATPVADATVRDARPVAPLADARTPAEGIGTPLASSSSDVRMVTAPARPHKGRIAAAAVAAFAIVAVTFVVVGRLWTARGHHPAPSVAASTPPPVPTDSPSAIDSSTNPPIAPVVSLAPLTPLPSTSTEAAAVTAAPARRAGPAGPSRSAATPPAAARPAAVAASPAPNESEGQGPASAPPPTPVTAPAKPVTSVEGREIRTGL
jgi:serine/threonine-protein kinase